MSLMRLGYRELGLKQVSFEHNYLNNPPMAEEKRDEGAGDPIKLLLADVLAQQRNEMMDHFSQILRSLMTTTYASSLSDHFGGINLFKVKVNFDIPILEG
jgi:hypothetical protein